MTGWNSLRWLPPFGVALWAALSCPCAPLAAQSVEQGAAPASSPAPEVGQAPAAAPVMVAEPSPELQAEYRAVVERAVVEFDGGRAAEARALFLRAHELWPSARTLRTLGMTSFELRAYARALAELQAALDDLRKPLNAAQRDEVVQLIERTRPFVGHYRVRLSPADATLLVDAAPHTLASGGLLVLEVGRHDLLARAPGHAELQRRLEVQGREDTELLLELKPEPSSAPASAVAPAQTAATPASARETRDGGHGRFWTWVVGGTAIALGGTSLALWLASDAEYDEEYDRCHPGGQAKSICTADEIDSTWQDLQTGSYVIATVAGVAGAAALALFFVEGGGGESTQVMVGPGTIYARGRF